MAARADDSNNLRFSAIEVGQVFEVERTFTASDIDRFAELSGDYSPLHVDETYAATTEFRQRVVHGIMLASLFSRLVGMKVPGRPALYLGQDLSFRKPVFVGEALVARARVTAKNAATRTIVLATEIRNSEDKVVVSGTAKVKVREDESVIESTEDRRRLAIPPRIDEKVALVTGGSRGIGAAIARELSRQGMFCVVNYRANDQAARRLLNEVKEDGGKAIAVKADVTTEAGLDWLVSETLERAGPPSALVNAAIGELEQQPAETVPWERFSLHLDTQVRAVLGLSQRLRTSMKNLGGGAIVNVLSQVVDSTPPTGMAHYVTAKYALLGLSKALAVEWASDGIRVNMVSPGLTRTELTLHYHERTFKMEASRTPLGRLVDPKDIARAVEFLVSDRSAFVTGANLFLTGGQTMP